MLRVRGVILQIHLATALIAGAFMVLLGTTGSIIAFQPELDRWSHPDLSYVRPGGKVLSLAEIRDSVSRNFPGEPIVAILLPTSPRFPTQVILSRGIVSVNQYTGDILGVRSRGQTFLGLVRALHIRLAGGDAGRTIMRWSGIATLLSLASGLWLWWPSKKLRVRGSWRRVGFWFDLHQAAGIVSWLPLMMLAATGTVIGFEDQATVLLNKLGLSNPTHAMRSHPLHAAAPQTPTLVPDEVAFGPDQAIAIAQAEVPGAVPYRIQMPQCGDVYVVSLATKNRFGQEQNSVSVNRWGGKVLAVSRFTDRPPQERLMAANEAIHTGEILGLPTQIMAALAGAFVPVQAATGLAIWLRRRKKVGQRV